MVRDIICPMDLWIWLTMLPCLLLGWKHSQELEEFQNWIKAEKNSSKSLGKFFSFFLLEWRLWFSDLMIVSSTILGKMDNFSKLVITEKLTSLEYTVLVRSSIIGFTHGPILILHIFRLYRSLIFFSKSWLEGAKYYQFMCKLENQLQPFLFFYPKTDLFAQSAPLIALCWFILNVTFPAGRYLQKLMDW